MERFREIADKLAAAAQAENAKPVPPANGAYCGDGEKMLGMAGEPYRCPTPCEEHSKSAADHQREADRHARAAMFLSAHPDFDQFIDLVRSGVIRI